MATENGRPLSLDAIPSDRLKNLNLSNLRAWAVLVQPDGSYSTLSPVVYGDIVLSINSQYNTILSCLYDCPPL